MPDRIPSLLAIICFLITVSTFSGLAQSDEDELQPVKSPKYSGTFGIGGGVVPHWYFVGTDRLNTALMSKNFPALPTHGMFLLGGHGYVYIMVIPNLRIGGMGAGGSFSAERADPDPGLPDVSWYNRSEFSTSFGGVTIEYVFPFKRVQVAIGGLLGGGSYSIALTHLREGARPWNGTDFSGSESRHQYSNAYLAYQPTLTVEYIVSPFTILSVTGGYYGASGSAWTVDDAFPVSPMPDLKLAAPFVRLGLTFGLFIPE